MQASGRRHIGLRARLRQLIPYSQTGFPDSLLPAGVANTELFDTNTFLNTPGGDLTGFEVTAQTPFTFLPGPFDKFGGQLSYTKIESDVSYVLAATIGAGYVNAPLTGQSPGYPTSPGMAQYEATEKPMARARAGMAIDSTVKRPGRSSDSVVVTPMCATTATHRTGDQAKSNVHPAATNAT